MESKNIKIVIANQLDRQMTMILKDMEKSWLSIDRYIEREELWCVNGEHVLTYGGPTIWVKDGILYGHNAGVNIKMRINKEKNNTQINEI